MVPVAIAMSGSIENLYAKVLMQGLVSALPESCAVGSNELIVLRKGLWRMHRRPHLTWSPWQAQTHVKPRLLDCQFSFRVGKRRARRLLVRQRVPLMCSSSVTVNVMWV
jgi:hypothetical protein